MAWQGTLPQPKNCAAYKHRLVKGRICLCQPKLYFSPTQMQKLCSKEFHHEYLHWPDWRCFDKNLLLDEIRNDDHKFQVDQRQRVLQLPTSSSPSGRLIVH